MTKNYSLAIFAFFLAVLAGLTFLYTGSSIPSSGNESIWFHAGLLTLLIGTYVIEYRFLTKPNDVFVNCLVVFVSTSTLTNPPYQAWWEAIRWGALICGIIAVALAWDPGTEARTSGSLIRTFGYQVTTRLGSAKVIFSIVFLLALISYFDIQKSETRIFVIVWGVFVLTSFLEIPQLMSVVRMFRGSTAQDIIGLTHSFLAPSIVYCERTSSTGIPNHQIVGFCQTRSEPHTYGLVIGSRASASENRIVVALLNSSIDKSTLNSNSLLVTVSEEEILQIENAALTTEIESRQKNCWDRCKRFEH